MNGANAISLCMIVRDEAHMLPACLQSVRDCVDQIVVVDTGSRDHTAQIARDAGATVLDFPWTQDFAAARNHGLTAAQGRWVLHLDADERLAPGAGAAIRKAVTRDGFVCGMLRLHDASHMDADAADVLAGRARLNNPVYLPRLLLRTDDLRWQGIVHESIDDWLNAHDRRVQIVDADIVHFGGTEELRRDRSKAERNITLLEAACRARPNDITPMGYLGMELLKAGRVDEARKITAQSWALLPVQPPHRSLLRIVVLQARFALLDNRPHDVLKAVAQGERVDGPQADFHYLRGFAYELLARQDVRSAALYVDHLDKAVASYRQSLAMAGMAGPGQFMDGATGWAGALRLGTVLLMRGRPADALASFDQSLALLPDNPEALLGKAEALLELGRIEAGFGIVQQHLGHPDPGWKGDAWTLAAAMARAAGMHADAEVFVVRAGEAARVAGMGWTRRRRLQSLASGADKTGGGASAPLNEENHE